MKRVDPMHGFPFDGFHPAKSAGMLVLLSVAVGAPALMIVHVLDSNLVFAALSVLFFAGAAMAALTAFAVRTERASRGLNLWDVAGGLVLTGCAASVFGEPENIVQLFEHLFERRSATQ